MRDLCQLMIMSDGAQLSFRKLVCIHDLISVRHSTIAGFCEGVELDIANVVVKVETVLTFDATRGSKCRMNRRGLKWVKQIVAGEVGLSWAWVV